MSEVAANLALQSCDSHMWCQQKQVARTVGNYKFANVNVPVARWSPAAQLSDAGQPGLPERPAAITSNQYC